MQRTMHRVRTMTDNVSTMMNEVSPNRLQNFDMVAEFARPIVNRAAQLWETIVFLHRWIFHGATWTRGFPMGSLFSKLERSTGPRRFDGRNPQFKAWSGDVKVYLIHPLCTH
eukprot:4320414-Amphidinium_carterae.1